MSAARAGSAELVPFTDFGGGGGGLDGALEDAADSGTGSGYGGLWNQGDAQSFGGCFAPGQEDLSLEEMMADEEVPADAGSVPCNCVNMCCCWCCASDALSAPRERLARFARFQLHDVPASWIATQLDTVKSMW